MCCFSKPVYRVSQTEIMVVDAGSRQITVYANKVVLKDHNPTAMLLPVPCSEESRKMPTCGVKVFDMTAATGLFERLDKLFVPERDYGSRSRYSMGVSNTYGVAAPLEVFRSGSYRYSIVPTLEDFGRLQHEVFGLDPASPLAHIFATHYSTGFAFIACIIDADGKFAPIAYEHDKHASGRVFVPTRHYHGNEVNNVKPLGSGSSRLPATGAVALPHGEHAADWDHKIYAVGCIDASGGLGTIDPGAEAGISRFVFTGYREGVALPPGSVPLKWFLDRGEKSRVPFAVPTIVHSSVVRKKEITGHYPNDDLWYLPDSYLRRPGVCSYRVTGTKHAVQDWFTCATCAAAGRYGETEGACLSCATRCHAGHAIAFAGRSLFFCDCGAAGAAAGAAAAAKTVGVAGHSGVPAQMCLC